MAHIYSKGNLGVIFLLSISFNINMVFLQMDKIIDFILTYWKPTNCVALGKKWLSKPYFVIYRRIEDHLHSISKCDHVALLCKDFDTFQELVLIKVMI